MLWPCYALEFSKTYIYGCQVWQCGYLWCYLFLDDMLDDNWLDLSMHSLALGLSAVVGLHIVNLNLTI